MPSGWPRAFLGPPNLGPLYIQSPRFLKVSQHSRSGVQRTRESYKLAQARPGLKLGLPARGSFQRAVHPRPLNLTMALEGVVGATIRRPRGPTQMLPALGWELRGDGKGTG